MAAGGCTVFVLAGHVGEQRDLDLLLRVRSRRPVLHAHGHEHLAAALGLAAAAAVREPEQVGPRRLARPGGLRRLGLPLARVRDLGDAPRHEDVERMTVTSQWLSDEILTRHVVIATGLGDEPRHEEVKRPARERHLEVRLVEVAVQQHEVRRVEQRELVHALLEVA